MRFFIGGIVAALITELVIAAVAWDFLLPRLDWGARQKPGAIERTVANRIVVRWVRRNAGSTINSLAPTPANLVMGLHEYEEHCSVCHGADGSGHDRFDADFYPPVPDLTQRARKRSDSELYFIISNGIRDTGMPAFGKNHSPDDIWRTILWVRHLAKLTTKERSAIARAMQRQSEEHREIPERGVRGGGQPR
jgi:mono/diheme cytochrome c family protein